MGRLKPLLYQRSGIIGKGALDLQTNNLRQRLYLTTDIIYKANKSYICDCCNKSISKNEFYVKRYKNFYTDVPATHQTFKLCLNCADKA